MINRRLAIAAAAALLATPAPAQQSWLQRPVTLIVPFSTGVTSDVLARGMADFLTRELGQSVIVENKGGAGGNIGAAHVARSKPDGNTFLFASTGQAATNKLMYKEMQYDPDKDFAPIVLVGKLPVLISAKASGPITSMQQLIERAKTGKGAVNVGFPGNGTLGHITGLLFGRTASVSFNEIQYPGSGRIIADLLGGHIDVAMDSAGAYMGAIGQGTVKPLALAAAKRSPLLPQTPTVSESGMPGFEASVWYGVFAPAGTSQEIIDQMNKAVNAYIASPAGQEFFSRLGLESAGGTPADLIAFIAAEKAKWGPVIKDAKIEF